MNYRELLLRYMAHVLANEGTSFLEPGCIHPGYHGITSEDIAELRMLSAEVIKSYVIEGPP